MTKKARGLLSPYFINVGGNQVRDRANSSYPANIPYLHKDIELVLLQYLTFIVDEAIKEM